MPMPRRRPDLPAGVGEEIPYDQTGLASQDLPPDAGAAPPPVGGDAGGAPMDLGSMGQPAPMDLGGLAQDPTMGAGGPDSMSSGMGAEAMPQSPEDAQVQQMAAALDDPNLDPATRSQIEQQLQLAARRQLAGLGG